MINMAASSPRFHTRSNIIGILTAAVLLIACSGFYIGLTFAPCHSSICVEHCFPSQTRIHIALFYGGVGIIATSLAAWSNSRTIRSFLDRYVHECPISLIGVRLSAGGTLIEAVVCWLRNDGWCSQILFWSGSSRHLAFSATPFGCLGRALGEIPSFPRKSRYRSVGRMRTAQDKSWRSAERKNVAELDVERTRLALAPIASVRRRDGSGEEVFTKQRKKRRAGSWQSGSSAMTEELFVV